MERGGTRISDSRTDSSDQPLANEIVTSGYVEASATTTILEVSASTQSVFLPGRFGVFSEAAATMELTFSPIKSIAQIAIDGAGYTEYFYSNGFVQLIDLTASETPVGMR